MVTAPPPSVRTSSFWRTARRASRGGVGEVIAGAAVRLRGVEQRREDVAAVGLNPGEERRAVQPPETVQELQGRAVRRAAPARGGERGQGGGLESGRVQAGGGQAGGEVGGGRAHPALRHRVLAQPNPLVMCTACQSRPWRRWPQRKSTGSEAGAPSSACALAVVLISPRPCASRLAREGELPLVAVLRLRRRLMKVAERLLVVRRLELNTDALSAVDHSPVHLGADAHERRKYHLAGVAPQREAPLDHVQLERVDVLLVLRVPGGLERQHAVQPHVVPEGRGVLPPDPVRVAVLGLLPGPVAVRQEIGRDRSGARVVRQAARVRDRDRILALPPEDEEVVGARNGAARAVLDDGLVGEGLGERAVADGQGFLPDVVAGDVLEADPLVQADDVPWEVPQMVPPRVAAGHVHAVDDRYAARHSQAVQFADGELVVPEEFRVVPAVRQVPLAGGLVVEPREGRGVDGQVHGAVWEGGQHLHAIAVVDGVAVRQLLVDDSHAGLRTGRSNAAPRERRRASFMWATSAANILSAATCFRPRFSRTPRSPSVAMMSTVTGRLWPKRQQRRTAW